MRNLSMRSDHFGSEKVFVSLELLTQCNFRCSYCYIFEKEENKHLVAADDFKDSAVHQRNLELIDKLGAVQTPMHFFILGGEPTIYQGLHEVVDNIYGLEEKYGIKKPVIEIITNGKKLENKEYVQRLASGNPDLRITISCHFEYLDVCDYPQMFRNLNEYLPTPEVPRVFYILLPEKSEDFLEVKDQLFDKVKQIEELPNTKIIFSLVNGYDIRSKSKVISEYFELFEKEGFRHLLNNELIAFRENGEDVDLGRFDFLKLNADAKVNYRFCQYNIYVLDKTGEGSGSNCSIVKETIDVLTAPPEEINKFFSVRPLVCTEEQCPINCTCMPKRNIVIND